MKANLKDVVKLIGSIGGSSSVTGRASETLKLDPTLTKSGYAADAKAVGDKLLAASSGEYVGDGSAKRVVQTGSFANVIMIYADSAIDDSRDFAAIVSPRGAMYVNGSYYGNDVCGLIADVGLKVEEGDITIAQHSSFNNNGTVYYWYAL